MTEVVISLLLVLVWNVFICILFTLTSNLHYLSYFLICYLPGVQKQVKKKLSTTSLLLHIKFLPLWIVRVMKIKVLKQPVWVPDVLVHCTTTCCSTTTNHNKGFQSKSESFQIFVCSIHLHANTQRSLWDLSCF